MEKKEMDKLNIEFASLRLDGDNVEEFYKRKYVKFVVSNSELTDSEKMEIFLSGQLNGETEILINEDLSEETFIDHELNKIEYYLPLPIKPKTRQKLLNWKNHLTDRKIKDPKGEQLTLPELACLLYIIDEKVTSKNFPEKINDYSNLLSGVTFGKKLYEHFKNFSVHTSNYHKRLLECWHKIEPLIEDPAIRDEAEQIYNNARTSRSKNLK